MMTSELIVVHPHDPVGRAVRMMAYSGIRHLPVVDQDHRLIGLVSQRDLLACDDADARVEDVMSTDVVAVSPDTAACEAAYLLWRKKIGCVPVTGSDHRLVGLLTEADFVRVAYGLLGGQGSLDDMAAEEHEADRV